MRNFIFYSIAGSVIWAAAQSLGAGFGVSLFASLLLPPLLIIGVVLYKSR